LTVDDDGLVQPSVGLIPQRVKLIVERLKVVDPRPDRSIEAARTGAQGI
jgi:hypothetical protein